MPGLRGPGIFNSFYGDASDGDLLVTGSYTLNRDYFYAHIWMSASAGTTPTIFTNGFRLFVASKLIYITSGTVDTTGTTGSTGAIPGFTTNSGSLSAGGNGGTGSVGNGQPGFPPPTFSASFGGTGGNGGAGGGTTSGPGGIASPVLPNSGSIHNFFNAMTGYLFGVGGPYAVAGGGGGGAGGGAGAVQVGGSGGGAGGTQMVAAREIISFVPMGAILLLPTGSITWNVGGSPGKSGISVAFPSANGVYPIQLPVSSSSGGGPGFQIAVTGTFQANGGPGGNGQAGGVTGGGGGGGGGTVINISSALTGALVMQALGGAGGASNGGGGVGLVGNVGSTFILSGS
jgi:hypothetical protein